MTAHRRFLAVVAALWLCAAVAAPALAHASLVSSTPADGASVSAAAAASVTLVFDDELDGAKSRVEIVDGGGATIATGTVIGDPKTMTAAGLALTAGDYQARWTAVASDGDITRGIVTFHVVAATTTSAASPAPSTAAGPVATTPPNPDAGTGEVLVPILAATAIIVVAGVLLLRRTRAA